MLSIPTSIINCDIYSILVTIPLNVTFFASILTSSLILLFLYIKVNLFCDEHLHYPMHQSPLLPFQCLHDVVTLHLSPCSMPIVLTTSFHQPHLLLWNPMPHLQGHLPLLYNYMRHYSLLRALCQFFG